MNFLIINYFYVFKHELFSTYRQKYLAPHESVEEKTPNELEKFKEIGARLKNEGQYAEDSTYQLVARQISFI